jgi:hypothetical protein
MAKVKVIGDVSFEFDVKFNQPEDIVIEAKAIADLDGKKAYIGTGNIEKIDPKAFSFITSRIEYFLKKNNAYTSFTLTGRDDDKIVDKIIEQGFGFLIDAMIGSKRAIEEMLAKKMFLLTESGIRTYLSNLKKYGDKIA